MKHDKINKIASRTVSAGSGLSSPDSTDLKNRFFLMQNQVAELRERLDRIQRRGDVFSLGVEDLGDVSPQGAFTYSSGKTLRGNGAGRLVESILNHSDLSLDDGENPHGTDFRDLGEVPSSYTGEAGKILAVNSGETGIEFTENFPLFIDDFMEFPTDLASTKISVAYWNLGGVNPAAAIVQAPNGVMRLSVPATANSSATLTFRQYAFNNNNRWIFQSSVSVASKTNTEINVGMHYSSADYVVFLFDSALHADKIYLSTRNNNGTIINEDTGVNLVTGTYYIFRLEVQPDNTFKAYINGSEVVPQHIGNIANQNFRPYFHINNKAVAEAKTMDIDYVKMWQSRS